MNQSSPAILFLHDGELAELREPLSSLGNCVAERMYKITDADRVHSWDLLLASSKRMLAVQGQLVETPALRIAMLDGDSKTLRSMLRRAGTDLIVRRPVHPEALRLLILHSLYRGPEKRRTNRVSIGAAVRYRSRLRLRNAILAELSPSGCRLLVPSGERPTKFNAPVTLQLPAELCGGRVLSVSGRIVRVGSGDCGTDTLAIHFSKQKSSGQKRLQSVIEQHRQGPAVFERHAGMTLPGKSEPTESIPDANENASDRRQLPRHSIERRIIALGEQASRVLMGRDLSVGGMRVDPAAGIAVGDKLKIALHVESGSEPLVIAAEVARDDGNAGLGLRFVDLEPQQLRHLEYMLGEIPAISEREESSGSSGLFVSEILDRETA